MHRPSDASTRDSAPAPAAVQPLLPRAALSHHTHQFTAHPHTLTLAAPLHAQGYHPPAPRGSTPTPGAVQPPLPHTPILTADRRIRPRHHHTATLTPYAGIKKGLPRTGAVLFVVFCQIIAECYSSTGVSVLSAVSSAGVSASAGASLSAAASSSSSWGARQRDTRRLPSPMRMTRTPPAYRL